MDWYVADKNYINYLTQFDSRVGYVEYEERLKLHVGILLTIGDFHYYVPISSAKPDSSLAKSCTICVAPPLHDQPKSFL